MLQVDSIRPGLFHDNVVIYKQMLSLVIALSGGFGWRAGTRFYDWLTEGFDTQDLEDAKALLDELR